MRFTFSIECQKGQDNATTDALSQVILELDAGTMKAILDGVSMGMIEQMFTIWQWLRLMKKYISKSGKLQC